MLSTQQHQQHLVESIQSQDHRLSEQILHAFSSVPRHLFVDHYYLHQPGTRDWTRYEYTESSEWYEQVYSDQALVTYVDQYGRSLSSSSQPSIMAAMLEALELQPGMRVLEVGTGTGYNAALLASLVEKPQLVTTLDIDLETIDQAKKAIIQVVGKGINIVQGDGTKGYSVNAPYDRILVTASSPTAALAWMEQLAPNGILVCVLQPRYALLGGILKAQKQKEELKGTVFRTASFMVLRDATYTKRTIQVDFRAPLSTSFSFDQAIFQPQLLRENTDFAFFLYSDIPDLYVFQKGEALIFSSELSPQGFVIFKKSLPFQGELRGNRTSATMIWNRLVRTYSLWLHCQRPTITQYQFEMDSDSQSLFLITPSGIVWPFITKTV